MIYISQWLCPQRHANIAFAWDDSESNAPDVERAGEELYRQGLFSRRCGICGGELHVEHGRTRFKVLSEALPFLKKCELRQVSTRIFLDSKKN